MHIWNTGPAKAIKDWNELPEVMKPEQVQQKIQISRTTFFRLVQSVKLPGAQKIGDSWRISRDKLRAYFEGEEVAAESEDETLREINKLGAEADMDEAKEDGLDSVRTLVELSRKVKENTFSCVSRGKA